MVDFGADDSFHRASAKLKEHYGVDVSATAVKRVTYFHSEQMRQKESIQKEIPQAGVKNIICESDGVLLPIVERKKGRGDARKRRKVFWKEAVSTLSYAKGSLTPIYSAGLGRQGVGLAMLHTAICAGFGKNSEVHIVGDGAKWIEEQADQSFGTQGQYLIDFYHLCEYLSDAIDSSAIQNKKSYLGRVKSLCKKGKIKRVLQWFEPFLEDQDVKNEVAFVRAAIRYIKNRPGQFDYLSALQKGLPIGSGRIESSHRYLIQKRMKITGAWWKEDNAKKMLSLRVQRANQRWNHYWNEQKIA